MATKTTTGKKKTEARFITPVFRISYPSVFEAKRSSDDPKSKPKFSCAAIWEPKTFTASDKEKWLKILKAMDAESRKAFSKGWKELPSNYRKGIRRGDEKEGQEGYTPESRFANLTSIAPPGVCDREKNAIHPDEGNADEVYPGAYFRATVSVYSFNKKGGKGIALGLRNLQKVKNGPRLDNRTSAEDDFDEDVEDKWLEDDDVDGNDGDDSADDASDDTDDDFG